MTASKTRPAPVQDDFDSFGGDQVVWEDLKGSLLFVRPLSIEVGINTQHGVNDAVYADIAVLDGEYEGDTYRDALVFPKTLVGQLRRCTMGKMTLGRLVQGPVRVDPDTGETAINPETGEPFNPPWKFEKPTDEDKTIGRAYIATQKAAARA